MAEVETSRLKRRIKMRFCFKGIEYICIARARALNDGEYLVSVEADSKDGKLILIPADSDDIIPVYDHD